MPNKHGGGGCKCCGGAAPPCPPPPITIGVTYNLCEGFVDPSLYPITVVVTKPDGTTTTLSGTDIHYGRTGTSPNFRYFASVSIPASLTGDYTFVCTGPNNFDQTTTITVANFCRSLGVGADLYIKYYPVYVSGCFNFPQPGASIYMSYAGGSASGTTDSTGHALLALSAPFATGSATLTVSADRWQPATLTGIASSRCGANWPLQTWNQTADCYICCSFCGKPHSDTMSITTPVGSATVKLGQKKKVLHTESCYQVKVQPGSSPPCSVLDLDPVTLQPILVTAPVEFFLYWTCNTQGRPGIGIDFAVNGFPEDNISTGHATANAKTAIALAAPSTVGAVSHCGGIPYAHAAGNIHAGGGPPIGCDPLYDEGPEHPSLTGSRYVDGEYTISEAGCGDGYDGYGGDETPSDPDDDGGDVVMLDPGPG